MTKYAIRWVEDGEVEGELFNTYEDANEMANYYQACADEGEEILFMSNPGDNPYDSDTFERPEYEIIEIDE